MYWFYCRTNACLGGRDKTGGCEKNQFRFGDRLDNCVLRGNNTPNGIQLPIDKLNKMEINENQLHELLGRGLVDFGATFHAGLVVIGNTASSLEISKYKIIFL